MPKNPDEPNKLQLRSTSRLQTLLLCGSIFVLVVILGLLPGCADNRYAENKEILSIDYQSLSNKDLVLYYQQLEDQIKVIQQDRNNSSISLGFGMGSYGSGYGGSGGVDLTTAGEPVDVITNLRDRVDDVELEMKNRNLTP